MAAYDHVVVGAGIVGSWTALQLRKLGRKTLLLDQFGEPNSRGSSHGQSRIIRSSYAETYFAEMMVHANQMWQELEEETGKKLILKAKFLAVADKADNEVLRDMIKNMKNLYPEHLEELKSGDINKKFPKTMKYADNYVGLLDSSGGIVIAIKALLTVQELFRQKGGDMWENCEVTKIVPMGNEVKLTTQKGDVRAGTAVICAGPWTQKLLTPNLIPSLPLEPCVVTVYYWKEKVKGAYSIAEGFPSFLDFCCDPNFFGLPGHEYPGMVKMALHKGVKCDPDDRDKVVPDPKWERSIKNYIKEHFPLCENEPSIIERCMYTMTPDEQFIVDHVPKHKNIIFGCGFSGTGFKTAPAIGRVLSEMALAKIPFIDTTPFKLSRFDKV